MIDSPDDSQFEKAECCFFGGRTEQDFELLKAAIPTTYYFQDLSRMIRLFSSPFVPDAVRQDARWTSVFWFAGLPLTAVA